MKSVRVTKKRHKLLKKDAFVREKARLGNKKTLVVKNEQDLKMTHFIWEDAFSGKCGTCYFKKKATRPCRTPTEAAAQMSRTAPATSRE